MNFYKSFLVLLVLLGMVFAAGGRVYAGMIDTPVAVDSRIKTFVYSPNEIFQVVLNYGYHSYIEFAKGESIKVIAMGDSVNWRVKSLENKLFIMPLEKEGQTNMLIETSKGRSYAIDLISRSLPDKEVSGIGSIGAPNSPLSDLAYIVRFYYPRDDGEFDLKSVNIPDLSAPSLFRDPRNQQIAIRPNSTSAHYVYSTSSTDNNVIPMELFDDGVLTYFKFHNKNEVIPKILISGKRGGLVPCKRLLLGDYLIVKGVHKNLYLDYGHTSVQVVNQVL